MTREIKFFPRDEAPPLSEPARKFLRMVADGVRHVEATGPNEAMQRSFALCFDAAKGDLFPGLTVADIGAIERAIEVTMVDRVLTLREIEAALLTLAEGER